MTVSQEDRAKQAFDEHQTGSFLSFRQFQHFMEDLELDERADEIEKFMYRFNYRSNCCTLAIGRCCATRFRNTRMKQVANRLKKYVEIENKRTPEKPVDVVQIALACSHVFGGYA